MFLNVNILFTFLYFNRICYICQTNENLHQIKTTPGSLVGLKHKTVILTRYLGIGCSNHPREILIFLIFCYFDT